MIDGHVWDAENKQTKWPSNWTGFMKQADVVVAMTNFGKKILAENGIESETIYHGVDTALFRPYTEEQREQLKTNFNFKGKFVVGGVFKNIVRKNPEKYLQAFALFRKGKEDKTILVLHTFPQPTGQGEYDLVQQAIDLGLVVGKDVIFTQQGLPTEVMPQLYNSMDTFWSLGGMEGFCTIPETKIIEKGLVKQIQDVKENDEVLTHTGKFQRVTKIFSRTVDEELIGIKRYKNTEILWVTKEHPILCIEAEKCVTSNTVCLKEFCIKKDNCKKFYSVKSLYDKQPSWKYAKDLTEWDIVVFPVMKNTKNITKISLLNYVNKDNVIVENDFIYRIGRNQFGKTFKHPLSQPMPIEINLTKSFMRMLGYFIAEGCSSGNSLIFAFNNTSDKLWTEDTLKTFRELNIKAVGCSQIQNKTRRGIVNCYSSILAEVFANWFGKGARKKIMPKWIFETSDELIIELLKGMYRGDGNVFNTKDGDIQIDFTTCSDSLIYDVYTLLIKLGFCPKIQLNTKGNCILINTINDRNKFLNMFEYLITNKETNKQSKSGNCFSYVDNEFNYFVIQNILKKKYSGKVYNIEVENDNSYVAGGITVHNCVPLIEAMACGVPTVALEATTFPEILGGTGLLSPAPVFPDSNKCPVTMGSYNGVEGVICDPYDIAKKTQKLYDDKQLRVNMGFKEVERAIKTFDWSIIRQQWVELLDKHVVTLEQLPDEWKEILG